MSRIHEALKKAAQERSLQVATGQVPDLAEVSTGLESRPSPRALLRESAARTVCIPEGLSFQSFDDLLKRCAHPSWQFDPQVNVFLGADNGRIGGERFRTLRSRLYQIAGTRPLKRVLVTSSVPAEGKTTVAANLAQSIVRQPDRKVLLIDADLRASRLHQVLGTERGPGLSDYLKGEADEFKVLQKGTDAHLCLIPAGSEVSNPSELL